MRTNIELDEKLMADALSMSGLPTRKAVVDEALRVLIRQKGLQNSSVMRDKVEFWDDADRKAMQTTLEVDETLMTSALAISGLATKAAVVDEALRILVRRLAIEDLLALRGKVEFWPGWEEERLNQHGVDYSS